MTPPSGDGVGGVGQARTDLLESLKSGRITGRDERLRAAAALFEGVLTAELFKAMRDTVPEGGAVSGGMGEDVFSGLMDQHLADAAAARSDGGIGEALYRHFAGSAADGPREPANQASEGLQRSPERAERRGNGGRAPPVHAGPEEAPGAAGRAGSVRDDDARGVLHRKE